MSFDINNNMFVNRKLEYLLGANFIEEYRQAPPTPPNPPNPPLEVTRPPFGTVGENRPNLHNAAREEPWPVFPLPKIRPPPPPFIRRPPVRVRLLTDEEFAQTLRMLVLQSRRVAPSPPHRFRAPCCSFCFGTAASHENGPRSKDEYGPWSTHHLMVDGYVTCPVLQMQTCEICGATGIFAHTTSEHDKAIANPRRQIPRAM